MPKTNIVVQLSGENGNVYNIIGLVSHRLFKSGHKDLSKQFRQEVLDCQSYDEVLQLAMKYVEVE